MSCSKPSPPFNFDVLYYLNRDQLERFSIVCRPMKNFVEKYFQSKPYRVFDDLWIRGGKCALRHNFVQWRPNREDYSVQQFLDTQKCSIDESKDKYGIYAYYSFAEMRPYLSPTVRIKNTVLFTAGDSFYSPEHIAEIESMTHLWRDGSICILTDGDDSLKGAEGFQPFLDSPTILKCARLELPKPNFPYKDYKVLYSAKVIESCYGDEENSPINPDYWPEFLEQPGIKPIVVFQFFGRGNIDCLLDRLKEAFSSATLPNAFRIVFLLMYYDDPLIVFQATNETSGEKLELKKGHPVEYEVQDEEDEDQYYTLERSSI
ncbi:hypothetical protein Ddc_13147 [Ditylenchus destructor]|nr:hypothetical protein Ddc_13147 [Ditylenchus destructor]